MWVKNKRNIECGKITVTCDVDTAQYDDRTVKCEKKNKGTTKCGKSTFISNVGIA